MIKRIGLGFFLLLLTLHLWAQDEGKDTPKKGFQKENMFVGGYLGLAFGSYTFINISPNVGYHFNKFFAAGLGINGQYVGYKDWDYNGNQYKEKQTILGLNIFGRAYPIRNVMLQVQPELNYRFGKIIYEGPPKQEYNSDAVIAPSLLMGGGLVFPAGRGETLITLLYDVLQNVNSPYGNRPIVSIGYNFGL
jgi:hypothetical protein